MGSRITQGIIFVLLYLHPQISFGQDVSIGIGYSYLLAKQWDKAIQTYNFSRPFIVQKQPLLTNGVTIYSSYLFRSGKWYQNGIYLSYSYFNSSSANENLSNSLHLHFVKPGYLFHFENVKRLNNFSANIVIAAHLGTLNRRMNRNINISDDNKTTAFGIGGSIDIMCAYRCLKINHQLAMSPYARAGFTPFFYAPGFETLLNQTKSLASKASTEILNMEVGIVLSRKR